MRHEDGLSALKNLLDEKDAPRAAAIAYVQELGQAASFEEAAEDFAVMISKLLREDLPVSAEAAVQALREAEDVHFSHATRLESILDELKRRPLEDAEPGDYIVAQRQRHEQEILVRDAGSPREAVRLAKDAGGTLVGNSEFEAVEDQTYWHVYELQEDGRWEHAGELDPNIALSADNE